MLQMEYLAQKLSAVGIRVAPEILQSVKDELSVETTSPINPPRVRSQTSP